MTWLWVGGCLLAAFVVLIALLYVAVIVHEKRRLRSPPIAKQSSRTSMGG